MVNIVQSNRTKTYIDTYFFNQKLMNRKIITRSQQGELKPAIRFNPGDNHEVPLENVIIKNPFKTKIKNPNANYKKDYNPKIKQKQFQRPYFSPKINSYECDLVFISNNDKLKQNVYLFLININTRYLYILMLHNKDQESILRAFRKLIYYGLRINSIRFDDEKSFNSSVMKRFFDNHNISVYHNPSPYINKNRIVDRAIRTIRDMYYTWHESKKFKKIDVTKQHDILQQLVTIYNNTYHTSIKMKPVEMNYELEYKYIDRCQKKLELIKSKQSLNGYYNFKYGDPIKIYLNESKTNKGFKKHRGNYIHDAMFIAYDHGNAIVKFNKNLITIPIYWIKV